VGSFDNSTLLRVTAQDIISGLNTDGMGSFADLVCTRKTRAALKGTEPFRATVDTLARPISGQAVGADYRDRSFALSSLNYDMLQYDEKFEIVDQEIIDLRQYLDPLGAYLATVRQDVNQGVDNDLLTLLQADSSTGVANGAWDVSTSTPISDMQDVKKTNVPSADIVVMGAQTALDLGRHPDFLARTGYYESGTSLGIGGDFAAVRQAVMEFTGIPANNIYVGGMFNNSANPGQAYSVAHIFDDFFWMGVKEGLCLVEQEASGAVDTVTTMNRTEVGYVRTLDLVRIDTALGHEITGTGT